MGGRHGGGRLQGIDAARRPVTDGRRTWACCCDAAKALGVTPSTVRDACNGDRRDAGGVRVRWARSAWRVS